MPLIGRQKKYLRGLAHSLKPVVHIDKQGLTEGVLESLDQALAQHELIKVRFVELKDEKREACASINDRLGSELAGMTGHVAIFYRPAEDPESRKIRIPG